jgi:hypothetical protein
MIGLIPLSSPGITALAHSSRARSPRSASVRSAAFIKKELIFGGAIIVALAGWLLVETWI